MTSIKLPHVSAPGCHPQGSFRTKGYNMQIWVLHRPLLEWLKYYNIKIHNGHKYKLQCGDISIVTVSCSGWRRPRELTF